MGEHVVAAVPRRLIVLCDGTFNDSSANTNVFKFKNALARPNQLVYYDEGVGITEEGDRKGWFGRAVDALAGGAFGSGLSRNVQQAYRWVCENYVDGDQLYFLGFSRGAYTARSVVGMIRNIGLIRPPVDSKTLREAFTVYRSEHHPNCPKADRYRRRLNTRRVQSVCLRFVGVWDTVGALGIPAVGPRSHIARKRWAFHDTRLSKHVVTARQALAVDEKRASFLPSLWAYDPQRSDGSVEQRWFAGCHSDVGGSAGELALRWMLDEARGAGLVFDPPLDQLPRPLPPQVMHESLSGFYRLGTGWVRRPIQERRVERNEPLFQNEQVDDSAKVVLVDPGRHPIRHDQRTNLGHAGKMRGPEPGYGLTISYYLSQYKDGTEPREPCCPEYRAHLLLPAISDHGRAGRWADLSEALGQIEDLAATHPKDARMRELFALALSHAGDAYGREKRWQERLEMRTQLERLAAAFPDDVVVHDQLAVIRMANGHSSAECGREGLPST